MTSPNREHTVELKLLHGNREELERRAVHALATGTNEEIERALEALRPRGRLTLCRPPAVSADTPR